MSQLLLVGQLIVNSLIGFADLALLELVIQLGGICFGDWWEKKEQG